jgi:hypothetical protein
LLFLSTAEIAEVFNVWTLSVAKIIFVAAMVMTECCWNYAVSGKMKYSVKEVRQCHFLLQKSHYDWPGIEFRPQNSETGDEPPQSYMACDTSNASAMWGKLL